MSRFASELFENSPALVFPLLALVLFFSVFIYVLVRVIRMKRADADRYARIPLEEEVEVPHD